MNYNKVIGYNIDGQVKEDIQVCYSMEVHKIWFYYLQADM